MSTYEKFNELTMFDLDLAIEKAINDFLTTHNLTEIVLDRGLAYRDISNNRHLSISYRIKSSEISPHDLKISEKLDRLMALKGQSLESSSLRYYKPGRFSKFSVISKHPKNEEIENE